MATATPKAPVLGGSQAKEIALDSTVFAGVQWGSSSVLHQTLSRIAASQQTIAILPERYDIDVEDDLRRFAADGDGGELGSLLREWGFAA